MDSMLVRKINYLKDNFASINSFNFLTTCDERGNYRYFLCVKMNHDYFTKEELYISIKEYFEGISMDLIIED